MEQINEDIREHSTEEHATEEHATEEHATEEHATEEHASNTIQLATGRRLIAKKIAGSILTILLLQGAFGLILGLVANLVSKIDSIGHITSNSMPAVIAMFLSGILSVIISWKLWKVVDLNSCFKKGTTFDISNRFSIIAGLLGALSCIFCSNIISEFTGVPNTLEDMFEVLLKSNLAVLYIGFIGPLVEELIFREGITGFMLRNGCSARQSIVVSAVLFGLIHINPIQVIFASLVGVALGILYWKTRNLWLCSIVHIFNNSSTILTGKVLPKEIQDMSFSELFGSPALAITCALALGLLSWLLLSCFCKTYKTCRN